MEDLPPSPPSFISDQDQIQRLQDLNTALTESLRKLTSFQKRLLNIHRGESIDTILDRMELLLVETIPIVYLQLYLQTEDGSLDLVRSLAPEDIGKSLNWSYVSWAIEHEELAILPLEEEATQDGYQSILLLPLAGNLGLIGLLILWVDFPASASTQEQTMLLTILAQTTASALEAHAFRQRIAAANAKLLDVVETVPHGILALDKEGRVNLINSTMEFMLGIRREDVIGQPYAKHLPPVVIGILDHHRANRILEEKEISIEIRGSQEYFGITVTPLRGEGESEGGGGHVVLCRDLKLSREVERLREVDAMKSDFLSLVSHELRTPLTSIMAYSETLLMEGMIEDEAERREYLQIIHDEGERLTRLINDVLDLTKMEAGKLEYIYEEIQINDVIRRALQSSASLIKQKGLETVTELDPNLPLARADSDRMMQVLMNLLSNAIKFTESGGRITIRSYVSEPFSGSTLPTITFSVSDTGCGIAPENISRVFSKFEQIESIDHHSVGTGLGMPICQQIIESGHGGKIWLESKVGVGTTFFVRIPLA